MSRFSTATPVNTLEKLEETVFPPHMTETPENYPVAPMQETVEKSIMPDAQDDPLATIAKGNIAPVGGGRKPTKGSGSTKNKVPNTRDIYLRTGESVTVPLDLPHSAWLKVNVSYLDEKNPFQMWRRHGVNNTLTDNVAAMRRQYETLVAAGYEQIDSCPVVTGNYIMIFFRLKSEKVK